jgi:hypothetical protein
MPFLCVLTAARAKDYIVRMKMLCGIFLWVACLAVCAAEPLVLAEGGKSAYRVVLAVNASPSTRYAAEEFRRFFKEATGAELPVVSDTETSSEKEILIGMSARVPELDVQSLGEEGCVLRTAGSRLVIAGGEPRGTLYGVYDFLENQLGCRWFTPAISRIPKMNRVAVESLDKTVRPALEYREVMLFDCWDADWLARNRVNTTKLLDERHGGSVLFVPGFYVHTFKQLVPPEKYFDAHPDYFAEVDGKRLRDGQLCATSEEVATIVTAEVRRLFREHPEARIVSVSQNDNKKDYCRCARCAALDEQEGTHAAQVLLLVNRVAEAVAKEFPDRAIETLAYEWSRTPPKTMKPRDNVIVRLSTIRCSFSEPLETTGGTFRRDLEKWSAICNRLWIWDYTTYFSYYLLPWPNYRVMDDNIRWFIKNNVRGITEQNNWQSTGGELAGLKGWLLARFLWNPEADERTATREFLDGVYGPAAPHIQAYLDLLADKVANGHISLPIYGSRVPPYLTVDILQAADALWEKAVTAVADQPEFLRRVQLARLSLDYAYIEHYRLKPEGVITYDGNPRRGKVSALDPAYRARIERFIDVSKDSGITNIREGKPDYEEYIKGLRSLFPQK